MSHSVTHQAIAPAIPVSTAAPATYRVAQGYALVPTDLTPRMKEMMRAYTGSFAEDYWYGKMIEAAPAPGPDAIVIDKLDPAVHATLTASLHGLKRWITDDIIDSGDASPAALLASAKEQLSSLDALSLLLAALSPNAPDFSLHKLAPRGADHGGMHDAIFMKVWGDAGAGDNGRRALAQYAYALGRKA